MSAIPAPRRGQLPWLPGVLVVSLVGYVFVRVDWHSLVLSLALIQWRSFILLTIGSTLLLLLADAFAITHVYRTYLCPIQLRDVAIIRGASYVPQLLNYHIGQAWMTWFASRVYGVPLQRMIGATLLIYATQLGGVFLLVSLSWLVEPNPPPWLSTTLLVGFVASGLYVGTLWLRPAFLVRQPAAAVLLEAGILGNVRALAFRLPHVASLFVGMWIPLYWFGIRIPLSEALLRIPMLMLVGALPLTPNGVGTRDALALELLAPFAPAQEFGGDGAIAAATLSWAVGLSLVHVLLLPLLWHRARSLLSREVQDA